MGWCESPVDDLASDGRFVLPFLSFSFDSISTRADFFSLLISRCSSDTSPPIERLAMYECAVAQVYSLCSMDSLTYELGVDSGSESTRWGNATGEQRPEFLVRARVYWYCFGESSILFHNLYIPLLTPLCLLLLSVHEAIKTGLKGGRLVMFVDFPLPPSELLLPSSLPSVL